MALIIIFLLCLGWTVKGVKENLDHNDYDVIRMGAELAMEGRTDFYDVKLEIKDRHFVYPPAAALLLFPLALPSLEVGAVLSAVTKGVMLLLLALACARSAEGKKSSWWNAAPIALIGLLVVFRPIDNDFGNGQVNIHLALLAIGGAMLMFAPSRTLNVIGALLFSIAFVIKPPPALIAGALLLHRRWVSLGVLLVLTILIAFGLPRAWFGAQASRSLFAEYSKRTDNMMFDAKEGDQVSIHEFLIFGFTQIRAPEGLELDDEKLYVREDGRKKRFKLEDPFSARTAKIMWVLVGALVGLGFLVGRWVLFRGRVVRPEWDIAALAVFCIILSPLARKAHLVILLYPVCYLASRIAAEAAHLGWKFWLKSHRMDAAMVVVIIAGFYASDDVKVPVPWFPMPLSPALLIAQLFILALLWRLESPERSSDRELPA